MTEILVTLIITIVAPIALIALTELLLSLIAEFRNA